MPSLPATMLWRHEDIDFWLKSLTLRAQDEGRSAIERAHAARKAAELALATSRQETARMPVPTDYVRGALAAARNPEIREQHITSVALFAGLCGELEFLAMSDVGVTVYLRDGVILKSNWTAPLASLSAGIAALMAVALAAGIPMGWASIVTDAMLEQGDGRRRAVALIARNGPTADILPAFGLVRTEDGNRFSEGEPRLDLPMAALVARENEYAASIRLAREAWRWHSGLYPPVPLIDWPLFCLELAWRRRGFPLLPTEDPSVLFIRELAETFE
jgi:hypothetical protein